MCFSIVLGYSYKYFDYIVSKPLRLFYSYLQLYTHGTDECLFSLSSLNAWKQPSPFLLFLLRSLATLSPFPSLSLLPSFFLFLPPSPPLSPGPGPCVLGLRPHQQTWFYRWDQLPHNCAPWQNTGPPRVSVCWTRSHDIHMTLPCDHIAVMWHSIPTSVHVHVHVYTMYMFLMHDFCTCIPVLWYMLHVRVYGLYMY